MRRITLVLTVLIAFACGEGGAGTTTEFAAPATTSTAAPATTTAPGTTATVAPAEAFPVEVTTANGPVTIEARPGNVVSLSSTATEMLFAIGAGDQVVAVDEFSTYPPEAPVTDLSGFTPNLEAIVGYEPDLVVISFDPGDLVSGLETVGVPTLLLPSASSLDDSYTQLEVLGVATGHVDEAAEVVSRMQGDIDEIVAASTVPAGLSFYHEVDATLYSATSDSFLGQVYGLLGLTNIADEADDGSGFPQLSSEYIVSKDPDIIYLGDVDFGVTPESLRERPGWAEMTAVQNGAIVPLDSYLASNWGPQVVELLRTIAESVTAVPSS
ncbi:MAG TPA: ABC transporter substrate-binding protein [Acidimicrobiia bacterium]|nr:ABC transporter substrate-binding protein [Acidimicrobiia bacterium]